jgi:glycine/D-amino acid oxidase-like deaminating enzyme
MNSNASENLVASTWDQPFTAPATCPQKADVVIIGGGIVGVSTAWFLAKQGVDVVLCEKGHIAGEQSSRNWGWVRCQGRDTRELPMMLESMATTVFRLARYRQKVWPRYPGNRG